MLKINGMLTLQITVVERGQSHLCNVNGYEFRCKKKDGIFASPKMIKRTHSFQTGDVVKVAVPRGKYRGPSIGRLASVRASSLVLRPKLKWQEATINATK